MTLKRKVRNLPEMNDQVLFFDSVCSNDSLADGNPRPTFGPEPTDNENQQCSSEGQISTAKISIRIKQIQNSIEQAQTMLESMDKFKQFMPGADEQRQKLEIIISNLEEQKASYTNLFDLITATEEERLTLMNSNSANDDDLSLRRNIENQNDLTPRAIKSSDKSISPSLSDSDNEENDLLTDINHLRNRLKVLRDVYAKKYQNETEDKQSPSTPTGSRLKNLRHIRDRLDELEQIVNYYQTDFEHEEDEEIVVYDHKISDELKSKQLELQQAKSTLNHLQQMVETIQPSSNKLDINTEQFLFSPQRDEKFVEQHREIERLVESRQRLHTIQDQLTSLHQTMATPDIYEQQLNDSKNRRPVYQSDESLFDEHPIRLKQSNVYASDTIVGKSSDDIHDQIREITRCLSTFIDEQKTFNRQIEQRLSNVTNSSDPMFNQLQQQVLTQGLIVNLNTAYREIAVLQSEINALQSENTRLTSSLSFDNQYFHSNFNRMNSSKTSLSSQSTSQHQNQIRRMSNPKRQIFEDSDDERQFHNLSSTVFNIQPSSINQNIGKVDVQTLNLQVKSIMFQLIPFMRFHINEIVDQSILNHMYERILFLFKEQPDSVQLIRYFRRQFLDLLGKIIDKYFGSTIRTCATNLIRDVSDLIFDELIKYKSNTDRNKENEYEIKLAEDNLSPIVFRHSECNSNDGREYILANRSINPKAELENESFL